MTDWLHSNMQSADECDIQCMHVCMKQSIDWVCDDVQAAREHAAGLEASAEREMASADEAYMLLGEAHSTVSTPHHVHIPCEIYHVTK